MNTYSRILQFRGDTIRSLIFAKSGFPWALRMFAIVMLIAGLGVWFGLGPLLAQSTAVENIDQAIAATQSVEADVLGALNDAATGDLAAIPMRLATALQERVAPLLGQVQGAIGTATGQAQGAVEAAAEQAQGAVESAAGQVPGGAQALSKAETAALAQLAPVTDALKVDAAKLTALLDKVNFTPQQLDSVLSVLRVSPERLAERVREAELTAEQVDAFLAGVRQEAVNAQPPLGVPLSRTIRLAGDWLDSPLEFAATWLFFVLALLLAARSLGGSGSLRQHLTAALLATAPAVLLVGLFIPPIASATGLPFAVALHVFARLIALIGVVWCAALLVKTVATAHGFTHWRALGAILLTVAVLLVVLPLFTALAAGFLLPL
jgi:hypothetical protein